MFTSTALPRRTFLKNSLLGVSSLALGMHAQRDLPSRAVTIGAIDVFPVNYPIKGQFKFLEGGRPAAIIKVTASDGTVGWGESIPSHRWSYETLETVTSTIRNYLAPQLIGHDVFDIAGAHQTMNRNIAPSFSTGQPVAKAGIDLALYDLVGKVSGQPLAHLWNRTAVDEITLSWTLNPERLEDIDALIDQGWQQGYRNFNVKVGTAPAFDLELCKRVKARVPEGFLWADANGGYDTVTAMDIAPKLAEVGVDVLEQPLPSNRLTGYRSLKRQGALPILMDEGIVSPETLVEFVRLDLLDGVAMKLPRCGGLMPAKRQIEIAQDAGLMVLGSGLTDPGISLAATLLLYGVFGYERPAALNGPQFLAASVLADPFVVEDGTLSVPTGAGLGIEVDEAKIQDLAVEI